MQKLIRIYEADDGGTEIEMDYEVLAPAGNIGDLELMLKAGADAVYIGLKGFSSRPSSFDFDIKDIPETVEKCHAAGKKIYVAINARIGHMSVENLSEKIKHIDDVGADAVILSDFGMIYEVGGKLKNAQIHVSTLANVYNSKTVKLLKNMGASRIIFNANLKFEEMAELVAAVPDMDYEVVAEGGTCFNDICLCRIPHGEYNGEQILFCRKDYDLYTGTKKEKTAVPICEPATKTDAIIALFMAIGVKSYKTEGRTVDGRFRVPMVKSLRESIERYKNDENLSAYLHYFARGFGGDRA